MTLQSARRLAQTLKRNLTPIRFATKPKDLTIKPPRMIRGADRISMGDGIFIGPHSEIRAIKEGGPQRRRPGEPEWTESFDPKISIGHRVWATRGVHIAAYREIVIESDVLIAANVFISDALHGYVTANTPYMYQPRGRIRPVRIEYGCWIGQNVVVMPGVTIGRLSIIGANSVVTRNIPARCIAVGAPARVIKRWDDREGRWLPSGDDAAAELADRRSA